MSKFFKVYDEFVTDWEWWNVYPHHPLFEWLLVRAKTRDCRVHGTVVRRGSLLTTWNEMQQAVSNKSHRCSRGTLARALEDLKLSGDLLLISDSQKTIVTICKYECYCGREDDIWTANGLQTDCKRTAPPIINKSKENEENNIYSARDGFDAGDGFVTDADCRAWMRRYSEIARGFGVADGDLPQQLTATRSQKISLCVRERGRGSVDAMFARLAESPNYFDQGSRGYRGDFTKLWSPSVFDMVLEGSFVPVSKRKEKTAVETERPQGAIDAHVIDREPVPTEEERYEEKRQHLIGMVRALGENPKSLVRTALMIAYENGELERYGIDWKPNNL